MAEAAAQIPFQGPAPIPESEKKGFFGARKPESIAQAGVEVIAEIANLNRATKTLEDKYSNLRNKVQVMDQNMLSAAKKTSAETRALAGTLDEFRRELEDIKEKLRLIIRELKLTAKDEDVKILNNYVDAWQPMNFVTLNQVEKIVKDILEKRR